MAVSREQVVQIIKGVVASPYVDQVQDFIADLEATIAEQAKELSESQKHINHLRMALADAEALELGTCERLARARSMLAQQAERVMREDDCGGLVDRRVMRLLGD